MRLREEKKTKTAKCKRYNDGEDKMKMKVHLRLVRNLKDVILIKTVSNLYFILLIIVFTAGL